MWYTYTREYYLAVNKNAIMKFAGKRVELETTMSEVIWMQKDKHRISLTCRQDL